MRIQPKLPPPEPRKALAPAGNAPGRPAGNAATTTTASGATARRAGFSEQSAFVGKAPDPTSTFQRQFGALASDKEKFHDTMRTVYGEGYDAGQAEQFRQKAQQGDFGWLPKVKTVSAETLQGANGAYDAESGTVLLNESLDPSLAASTFVEEAGHHLDTKLNTEDTVGDEGELFRRVLSGEKLSSQQVSDIRAENDKGIIRVDGKDTAVEFWKPFKFISDGVKAVGGAIVDGAKAVGNAIVDGAKAVGNAVTGAAKAVGNAAEVVGGALKKVGVRALDGLRSIGTGIINNVKGVVRNVGEGMGTFFGGIGKLFQGKFGDGLKQMGLGLVKTFVQTPIDVFLMGAGRGISAIQTLIGAEPVGRKPTADEIKTLREVYGDSIDYSSMRIKEGKAGLFSTTGRAFTHGDTIYIPPDNMPMTPDLLIHEAAHVWQHQNGGTDYMSEALYAQNFGDAYDFGKALDEGKSWSQLDPEQQGQFLSEAHRAGYFANPAAGYRVQDPDTGAMKDYTAQLEAALAQVRAGEGAP
ncbi:hypothetical protein [Corallococcus terminator]|uniref:DUF4157 domain-containing protein n=1 Tax=Corallococcus terminator TaxID=2316733 RepID=A0A3A8J4N0_9BACT|nr:hypothetical protein [Corallococcus terminator]RKG87144.1 hypothetical protein D7V88_16570 [Corallococcus terminator]